MGKGARKRGEDGKGKQRRPKETKAVEAVRRELQRELEAARGEGQGASLSLIARLGQKDKSFGRSLAWLVAYEQDQDLVEAAMDVLELLSEDDLPDNLRSKQLGAAFELSQQALRDPELPDARKVELLAVLAQGQVYPGDHRDCFQDFDTAAVAFGERMLTGLTLEGPRELDVAVDGLEVEDSERFHPDALRRAFQVADRIASVNPRLAAGVRVAGAAAAYAHGQGDAAELARQLERAAQEQPGLTRWLLEGLAVVGGPREQVGPGEGPGEGPAALPARARSLADELAGRGVAPEPLETLPFLRGYATALEEGTGGQALCLLFDAAPDVVGLILQLDPLDGLRDIWAVWGGGEELLQDFRQAAHLYAVDLPFARSLVADALTRQRQPAPGVFVYLRALLGPEPIVPARHEPDLSAYPEQELPEDVSGTTRLGAQGLYGGLSMVSEAFFAQVRAHGPGEPSEEELTRILAAVEGPERAHLAHRIGRNLELEARQGRVKGADNLLAARVWHLLRDPSRPWAEIPLVRAAARASFAVAGVMVSAGFASFVEARRAMEEDRAAGKLPGRGAAAR
ncbi:MAG: hypothetical protein AB7N76_19335 [Planctomycetota bacterium]